VGSVHGVTDIFGFALLFAMSIRINLPLRADFVPEPGPDTEFDGDANVDVDVAGVTYVGIISSFVPVALGVCVGVSGFSNRAVGEVYCGFFTFCIYSIEG
jgi:hypothetical protein